MNTNNEINLAYNFVCYTDKSIFLTGKAGTGKTTFLKRVVNEVNKRIVVVAPTGVAAINAGGVTIHSFFQMPFGPIVPGHDIQNKDRAHKVTKKKIDMIRALDMVIIDEISMVRADLLDGIDQVLRKYRRNSKPFGGVQMLMIGDLQQLAPVARQEEWSLLQQYYETPYFFSSQAFLKSAAISIALKQVYRQTDHHFLSILEEIRNNTVTQNTLMELNDRHDPHFAMGEHDGFITLSTHNASANTINARRLDKINQQEHSFKANITGKFPEHNYPTEENLILKEGAQVMFVKNDPSPDKQFFNGKIGVVTRIEKDVIYVQCEGDENEIACEQLDWENKRYDINEKSAEMTEQVVGTFSQYPLRLAWAITIHKSQGLTFDKVIIDAELAFAHGQTYVALSRCRTLEGIVLSTRINQHSIICDRPVAEFTKNIELNPPTLAMFDKAKRDYQKEILFDLFDFNSLDKAIFLCSRFLRNAIAPVSGNLSEVLDNIGNNAVKQVENVGIKFNYELKARMEDDVDAEHDPVIQERLIKSAGYFSDILINNIKKEYDNASWEVDNTTVRNQLKSRTDEIGNIINEKVAILNALKEGFTVKRLLDAKAKSLFDKKSGVKKAKKDVKTEHPGLYRMLAKWRAERAKELGVPLYFIASQQLLITITNELPVEKHHLLSLPGLGKKRVEYYGADIMDIVLEYCTQEGISPGVIPLIEEKEKKKRVSKSDSAKSTLELHKKGLSLEEIAIARDLTAGTISTHLAMFITSGEVKAEDFVSEENIVLIEKFLKMKPDASMKQAKDALSDDISYEDLRFVFAAKKADH